MANKRKLNEHDVPEETSPQSAKRRASDASETEQATTPSKPSKANTAPAASFAEFELEPRLLRGIRDQKWSSPTAVQSKAIPLALQGRDILARSGTGTGKTAAYLLPVLHNALRRKGKTSLILVPTKELALQITKVAKALSTHCGQEIRIQNIAGKESDVVTKAKLADNPDIVIATPARASANINTGALSVAELAHLVVDEGDLVMGYGFKEDLDQIAQNIPKGVQIFLMSATLNTEVESLGGLREGEAICHQVRRGGEVLADLRHVQTQADQGQDNRLRRRHRPVLSCEAVPRAVWHQVVCLELRTAVGQQASHCGRVQQEHLQYFDCI